MKLNLKQSWIIAQVEHVPRFQEKVSLHYIAQSSRVIEEIKKRCDEPCRLISDCYRITCLLLFIHQDLQNRQPSIIYSKIGNRVLYTAVNRQNKNNLICARHIASSQFELIIPQENLCKIYNHINNINGEDCTSNMREPKLNQIQILCLDLLALLAQ